MSREAILNSWIETGEVLHNLVTGGQSSWKDPFESAISRATIHNPWFTRSACLTAFDGVARMLESVQLRAWAEKYPFCPKPEHVGVIMAGNIPMAGFHDMLCVTLSGNRLIAKMSGSDQYLLPFVSNLFHSFLPEGETLIDFTGEIKKADAIIATGSNNTSRYFDYYFGHLPHIFRKNRNSVAVITGSENEYDFLLLGRDIFTYYGLGCRNVSKLYVPEGYVFDDFFQNIVAYGEVMQHTKYMNNFDYHQALYLLNKQEFLTNNFIILLPETALSSPVGVLFYETYKDIGDVDVKLESEAENIQCVVSKNGPVPPGQAQFPMVSDYADGLDTMRFLTEIISKN